MVPKQYQFAAFLIIVSTMTSSTHVTATKFNPQIWSIINSRHMVTFASHMKHLYQTYNQHHYYVVLRIATLRTLSNEKQKIRKSSTHFAYRTIAPSGNAN